LGLGLHIEMPLKWSCSWWS